MDDNAPQQGPASASLGSPAVLSRRFGAALEHLTRLFRRGEGQSLIKGHGRGFRVYWLAGVWGNLRQALAQKSFRSGRFVKKGALTPIVLSDAKGLTEPSLDDKAEESSCGRSDALTESGLGHSEGGLTDYMYMTLPTRPPTTLHRVNCSFNSGRCIATRSSRTKGMR